MNIESAVWLGLEFAYGVSDETDDRTSSSYFNFYNRLAKRVDEWNSEGRVSFKHLIVDSSVLNPVLSFKDWEQEIKYVLMMYGGGKTVFNKSYLHSFVKECSFLNWYEDIDSVGDLIELDIESLLIVMAHFKKEKGKSIANSREELYEALFNSRFTSRVGHYRDAEESVNYVTTSVLVSALSANFVGSRLAVAPADDFDDSLMLTLRNYIDDEVNEDNLNYINGYNSFSSIDDLEDEIVGIVKNSTWFNSLVDMSITPANKHLEVSMTRSRILNAVDKSKLIELKDENNIKLNIENVIKESKNRKKALRGRVREYVGIKQGATRKDDKVLLSQTTEDMIRSSLVKLETHLNSVPGYTGAKLEKVSDEIKHLTESAIHRCSVKTPILDVVEEIEETFGTLVSLINELKDI